MYIPKWIVFGTVAVLAILAAIIVLLSLRIASSESVGDVNPVSPILTEYRSRGIYGFSFSYPGEYTLEELGPSGGYQSLAESIVIKEQGVQRALVSVIKTSQRPFDWVNSIGPSCDTVGDHSRGCIPGSIVSISETGRYPLLAGHDAVTYQMSYRGTNGKNMTVANGDYLINVEVYGRTDGDLDAEADRVFDMIFASFRLFTPEELYVESSPSQLIKSSEITPDCQIKLQIADGNEKYIPTHYTDQTRCYQFVINKVSPSRKYVVFQDVSDVTGGASNEIHLYSADTDAVTVLDSLGASKIYDIAFLPDDRIISLHRYADGESIDIEYVTLYDPLKTSYQIRYPLSYYEENYTHLTVSGRQVMVAGDAIPPHVILYNVTPGGLDLVL